MISRAIDFAARAHKGQLRKGTGIPYITHPLAVGTLLARAGCSDEVIVAGILHDTVEDTDVEPGDLEREFGPEITAIVMGASEPDRSAPWNVRKEHTHEYLRSAPEKVRLVALADKLHNICSMAMDLEEHGEALWDRFNEGKERQAWYYRGLLESFSSHEQSEVEQTLFEQMVKAVDNVFGSKGPS